ncbi:hypothetical protein [Pedobacter puniceum]|uniref:Uncharacterized protein n=1 Tax=Pedobacter puniceum TaxID=2666136 RepID=A0A7K0FM99_9SPHI|nr:hypothetical protein [Pedobacter puniceum]MRX46147.1 hypothetical protein [Pedobacter puniceum]
MSLYYVNHQAQPNGDHEVHKEDCIYLPYVKKFLGSFSNCADAVKEAKKTYTQSNGCRICSKACHTK